MCVCVCMYVCMYIYKVHMQLALVCLELLIRM